MCKCKKAISFILQEMCNCMKAISFILQDQFRYEKKKYSLFIIKY